MSPDITTSVESFATAQYDENLPPVWSSSDACLASSTSYLLFNQATNELFSGKKHYNEFYVVKMARQLMAENDDDDDAADDGAVDAAEKSKSCDSSHSPMDTGPESQI